MALRNGRPERPLVDPRTLLGGAVVSAPSDNEGHLRSQFGCTHAHPRPEARSGREARAWMLRRAQVHPAAEELPQDSQSPGVGQEGRERPARPRLRRAAPGMDARPRACLKGGPPPQ